MKCASDISSEPCCQETYDNEEIVCEMVQQQKDMRIPTEFIPHCGKSMTMNLRADNTFVQDEGWHQAAERYSNFLRTRDGLKTLYLELGGAGITHQESSNTRSGR